MNATQLYTVLGIVTLMLAVLTQASRAIFRTGKLIQIMEDMKEDLAEVKVDIKTINERTYQSAIRGAQRGR
jgi:hypothetical protein